MTTYSQLHSSIKLPKFILFAFMCFYITVPSMTMAAQSCPIDPKFVFILDDSGSIDDIERAEMTTSIQSIADKIELAYPNAQFGVVQYGTFPNPTTPEDGTYDVVMGYTINPIFSIIDNPSLLEDHLPDSIDQMITDDIFTTGVLSNPDAFFIFTDAARNSFNAGVCCSNLENALNNVSADAEPGFGEYSKLAALSTTGNVSLYQVINAPTDSSPEIVQGAGVHQIGNFSLAQADIDSISDSLCSTPELPDVASCTSNTGYLQNLNLSENYSCFTEEGNFGKVVSGWDLVLGTAEAYIHDAPSCQYRPNVEHIGGAAPAMTNLSAYSGVVYGGLHNYGSGFGGDYTYPREVVIQNLTTNLPAGLSTELSLVSATTNYEGTNKWIDKFGNPGTWQLYGIRAGASYTPPSGAAACSLETDANVDLLGTTGLVNSLDWQTAKVKFTTSAEYDRVIFSPTCGLDSYLLFDCVTLKAVAATEQCYAITDDNTSLYKFDLDPSTPPTSVSMSRIFNGEALAYRATNNALYAFHQTVAPTSTAPSDLYKIELDGTDTLIATDFLDSRASGAEFISYSDGTEQLVVLMREKDSKIQFFDATDLPSKTPLKTLDLTYPDGSDVEHMDGLAVNPTTGEMLIMKSHSPDDIDPEIYSVNTNTGVITHKVTLVVTTPEIDAESFAFSSDGNAYTETEKGQHRIFRINLTTGALTEVEKANLSDDIEGMACIGSTIKTPPPIQRCPSGITPVVNGLKIDVPNSPWPGDPSITYTLTATNYQATNPNINAYRPPGQGILRGAKDGDQAHKQNSNLPTTLNIKLSQPVPAHQFYFYAQDIETQMGDDNAGTLKIISGTATPADFMQGSWSNIKAPGAYNPLTGKVTMTNMGDTSTGDQGMFFLLGETLATVQELEISTGSYLSAGDYVGHILTNIGCTIPSISGSVFNDDNTNDIFDAAESGLADIKVWVQAINADGTLDPTKVLGSTDAQGGYIFPSLVDGDYQVHVDTTDVDIPIDRVLGGTNPLVVTVTSSGVRDVDFPFDQVVCAAFSGEVSEVSLPISSQLKTTDKIFVPSRSISPIEGHLRAYSVGSNGKASTTVDWDAATRMSKEGRATKLYSSNVKGKSVLFKSLDKAAFGNTGALKVSKIKAYTINPSKGKGKYLAGRKKGSFLGGISKGNNVEILSNSINTSLYLHDVTYRTFYTSTISSRNKRVLMNSDDGFLYSFDYETGDLVWAWMPRSLASDLSDFSTFQSKHLMAGSVEVLDLKDSNGVYATYIVGSYKNGLGHYVLKLSDSGALQSVVWDDDQSSAFVSSPDAGAMEFFSDDDGQVFAAYAVTNNLSTSQLKIRSLTDEAANITVDLSYEATSVPFVMQNYGKSNAPDKKTIYIGTSVGNIHSAGLLDKSGSLVSSDSIKAEIESSSVAEMYVVDTEAVTHIDSSISIKDNRYYLITQTDKRLTTHLYLSSTGTWRRAWTSAISSAGEWDNASIYTETSAGSAGGIQSLPVGTTITDKAVIVGDIVFLPISVLDPSAAACYGKAYYFLYNLSDGGFPKSFKSDEGDPMMMGAPIPGGKPEGDGVGDNIKLGYGEARRLTFTDIAGSNNLLVGYGIADKRLDLTAGIATSFNIENPVSSGLRSWKEIGR